MQERPVKTKINYPVSLDEAKRHLRIDDSWDKDDDYIRNLIYAATEICEQYIGKDISGTTNTLKIWDYVGQYVYLDEGNWNTITSVLKDDGSTQISVVEEKVFYNGVELKLSGTTNEDPLYVNYKTGFTPGKVPYQIKTAVLIKIGDLYDVERQSYSAEKENYAFQRLLDPFKIVI